MKKNKNTLPFLMLAPGIILMLTLVFYPVATTFCYSLRKMKLTDPASVRFAGFENYYKILVGSDFWYALLNSLSVLVIVAVLAALIGFLSALLLNVRSRVQGALTAIAIIPWALPPVVNGLMWRWIFHPGYGFLNRFFLSVGLIDSPVQWLSDRWQLVCIAALVVAWRNIPFCAVVFLSALQSMPRQLYESATIDGCTVPQTFAHITFPLLLPALSVTLTATSINAINVFDEIVSLSGYGDAGKTLMIETYLKTFSFLDFGIGSALASLIMILAGILGLLYVKNVYREVTYL